MKSENEKKTDTEEDLHPFRVRAYSKVELSMLYNPAFCLTNALHTLATWIRLNFPLWEELTAIGYNKYRRCFTPREVSLIVKYLGEP
ncbi:MAG: DUF4248 domain-containing protein [Bacteroides sp.]|nr:DUF4248 domain-containing protein [Bacteroides sp.]